MEPKYCAAPWRGLHINPRGDVKTCCAGDPNMLGNLNQQTIDQILHGPVMKEIRQTVKQGKLHPQYCYNCLQSERYGRSERDWHNRLNPDFDPQQAGDTEHRPVLIDVRWNTTCNLSCNYCNEWCSSKWAAIKSLPFKSGARPYYEQVCDYLAAHSSNIREVALVGGEPLLLPENERLLDVVPQEAVITLITNVQVDFSSNKIFQKLQHRDRVGWSLSFDNIADRYEYVRSGSRWDLLQHNLDLLTPLLQQGRHWGGIHAVYNLYSATRLVEFTEWARDRGLGIHWQSLFEPECLDPTKLGSTMADLACQEIDRLLQKNICQPGEQQFFQNVLQGFLVRDDLRNQLKTHIHDMELRYHPQHQGAFQRLWPELSFLMDQ